MIRILQYLGLLSLCITTLLGSLLLLGNDQYLVFIFGSIVLSFVVFYLVKLMIAKKKATHKSSSHIILLWFLYIIIAFFSGIISLHFITVQFIANDDLRKNGIEKMETIVELRNEFDAAVDTVTRDLTMEVRGCLEGYLTSRRNSPEYINKRDDLLNVYKFSSSDLSNLSQRNINRNTDAWIDSYITDKILYNSNIIEIKRQLNDKYLRKAVFIDSPMDYLNMNNVYCGLDAFIIAKKIELEEEFYIVVKNYNMNINIFDNLVIPATKVELDSHEGLRTHYHLLNYSILYYLIIHLLILLPLFVTRKDGKGPLGEVGEELTRKL